MKRDSVDTTIDFALIGLGVFTICVAVFVHNRYAKLALLAWEFLP